VSCERSGEIWLRCGGWCDGGGNDKDDESDEDSEDPCSNGCDGGRGNSADRSVTGGDDGVVDAISLGTDDCAGCLVGTTSVETGCAGSLGCCVGSVGCSALFGGVSARAAAGCALGWADGDFFRADRRSAEILGAGNDADFDSFFLAAIGLITSASSSELL